MNLFELRGTSIITERKINDISTIKSKMEARLNSMKARTYISGNVIDFKTISILSVSGYIRTNPILFRIYKEGNIIIDKQKEELKISWAVKLDSLYFLALCCSIIVGIFASISTELVISVSTGVMFFLMFAFIGIVLIRAQLNDLINSSVYRNYY